MMLGFQGCSEKKPPNVDTDMDFWESFYQPDESEKIEVSEDMDCFKASHGYNGYKEQGKNGWYYYEYNGSYTELAYNEESKSWENSSVSLCGRKMTAAAGTSVARGFMAIKDGEATICGNVAAPYSEGATFSIYWNDTLIYPAEGKKMLEAGDYDGYYFSVEVSLAAGDMIYFVIEGQADCNPTVNYGEQKELLYQVPDWNFYGDVHPFYYNGKMYMYNLQGYLEDVGNERYLWCLHTSTDMFNYTEEDYYLPEFVQNHYNSTLVVYESIFDKQTFPYGSRDMFLFFDEGAQRYIYIGLCYYKDKSSCLGVRVSDDETGMKWSEPMYSLRDFDFACDPECTQALYINDRWYIITSIWGQSIHSVGRPTYFIGDKGKDFLENNWAEKEPHYLDGEDLCAAQLVDVGDGHWLMYGWIPKTSYTNTEEVYFNGERDHGLWGGNINVAREVYQNEDGTLSTRLDGQMQQLLSRGKLFEADQPEMGVSLGTFGRSYITFEAEVGNGDKVSYTMKSAGKTYYISLEQRKSGGYMSISCPDDSGHRIASEMYIGKTIRGTHNFRILVDHSIVEFYMDDAYSLSARISMFAGDYEASIVADGDVEVTNLEIHKLAHQEDVYD